MREIWSGRLSAGMRAIIPEFGEQDIYYFQIGDERVDMRLVSGDIRSGYAKRVYFGRDDRMRYELEVIQSSDVIKLNYCFANAPGISPMPCAITAIYAEDDVHDPTAN